MTANCHNNGSTPSFVTAAPGPPADVVSRLATPSPDGPLRFTIAANGTVRLDGTVVDLAHLRAVVSLRPIRQSAPEAVVVPDPAVPYDTLIHLMDALRAAGIDRVAISGPGQR